MHAKARPLPPSYIPSVKGFCFNAQFGETTPAVFISAHGISWRVFKGEQHLGRQGLTRPGAKFPPEGKTIASLLFSNLAVQTQRNKATDL